MSLLSSARPVNARAEYWALATVFFANGAGFASWVSRIPAVRDALHLSEGELGLALLCLGAGALVAFPLAGRGIGHVGARALTVAAGLAYCYALPHPAIVNSSMALMATLFLLGAANGAMDVAMNALAVEVEARQQRPIMSTMHGLWSAGGLCGAALGSAMAHHSVPPGWHLGAVAAILAATLVLAYRWLEPTSSKASAERGPLFARPEAGMAGLGAIVFCSFLIEGAMADWSAVYLKDSLGATAAMAALGYAVFACSMMGMRLAGDRLAGHSSAGLLLRMGNAAAALVLAAALWVGHTGLMMVACGAVGIGVAMVAPRVFSAAARRTRRGHGHAIAAMATLGYGGFLLGPPLIGWLAQLTELRLALSLLVLLAAVIAWLAPSVDTPASAH